MKRGGPLRRTKPLRSRSSETKTPPWQPVPAPAMDLDAARAALAHQQASAAAPPRVHAPVPDPVKRAPKPASTGFPAVVRQTIIDRDGYLCVRCGVGIDGGSVGYNLQHRKARAMGGTPDPARNRPSNGIVLCGSATTGCHHWVEAHPEESEQRGWSVASWADPTTVPVHVYRGDAFVWLLLDDRGNAWPTAAPAAGNAHNVAQRAPLPTGARR